MSAVETELIIRGVAKVNPIREYDDRSDCIFCEGHHHFHGGFSGHKNDCAYKAAVEYVERLEELKPKPKKRKKG